MPGTRARRHGRDREASRRRVLRTAARSIAPLRRVGTLSWILRILRPTRGILGDIPSHPIQIGLIANDMLMIVRLPGKIRKAATPEAPGGYRLKRPEDGAEWRRLARLQHHN